MKQIIIFLIGMLFVLGANANEPNAYVTRVYDGDTITFFMLDNEYETLKGRLYGIDAPELKQEHGVWSRNYLRNRILNKKVQIQIENTDRYGRSIITIYDKQNDNINLDMTRQGMAWSYRSYNDNSVDYNNAEQFAQDAKLGLWQHDNPIEPWSWRKLKRYGIDIPTNPDCDYTLTCTTIDTCKQAKFLLNTCGFKYLDGSGNGVPCQNLCEVN